jgi:hypothetical protein
LICSRVVCRLARAHAYGIEPSRPLVEHSRSHSRTCRFNSSRTSAWIKRARRTWLHLTPPSLSHLDIAFASSPFLSARHAITISPPSRGPWFTCLRVMPFVVLSSTASDRYVVHLRSWHHFSRGQHFVEHLNCIFDTATSPVLAQGLGVACFGLAALLSRTLEPRASLARMALPLTCLNPLCAPLFAPGRSPPLGSCSCAHTPTPLASVPCLLRPPNTCIHR